MFYSFSPNINSNPYNKLNTSSRYLNNATQLYPATKYLINKQEGQQQSKQQSEHKKSQDLFDIALICNLEARTYEDSIAIDTINYYFRKLDTKYNMKFVLEQLQLLDNLINYITQYLQQGSSRTSQADIQQLEQSQLTQQSIQSSQFQQLQQEFYSIKDNTEQQYIFSNLSPNFNNRKLNNLKYLTIMKKIVIHQNQIDSKKIQRKDQNQILK
ncbi:hypothetical protein pb186bvf_015310 [Paramecium bursaria]